MKKISNIILTGLPGCGKTTIGRALSEALNLNFIDLDLLIEKNEDKKISEIFKEFGEEYFRRLETKTIQALSGNFVLSLGGGTIENSKNIEILKKLGTIVYIEVPIDLICNRLRGDKTRPLLQNENMENSLFELYKKRKENYEKADYKVEGDKTIVDIVKKIKGIYEKING